MPQAAFVFTRYVNEEAKLLSVLHEMQPGRKTKGAVGGICFHPIG